MKKLEIDLLLQDLENTNIQIEKKLKKLDTIILYYMEENIDSIQPKEKNNPNNNDDNTDMEDAENNSEGNQSDEIPKSNDVDEGKKTEENDESEKLDDLPHKEKNDNLPSDIKKLYRKITIKTHPDKNNDNDEYDEYYKKVVKAKEENDKATILFTAYELELKELYDVDQEHFSCIKKRIAELEIKTKSLDNNPFWIWYHSDNKHLRRVMIDQITKMRSKK